MRIPPVFFKRKINSGAPKAAVKIETGISELIRLLAAVSIKIINTAPKPMLAGTT